MTARDQLRGEMDLEPVKARFFTLWTMRLTIAQRVVLRLYREIGHVESFDTAIDIEHVVLDHSYIGQ
jgi:hypothetical protein